MNHEFSPWPAYSEEEAEAVSAVLLSNKVNYWTGQETVSFESEFASYVGADYGVALANGTVALEIALEAIGIKMGDEVIVPSRSFVASASAVVRVGAIPVFADIDVDTQNVSVTTIEPVVSSRTKAIICVHLAGWPCDMDPICELAGALGLYVIEDCAQAHGAFYKGRSVGSLGDVGCWSFCQDKIISTGGEGGMITTSNPEIWRTAWSIKDHGKSMDKMRSSAPTVGFRWVHDEIGSNYRMTEMQAAIGRIQLKRLPVWNELRLANAKKMWGVASNIRGLRVPKSCCQSCPSPLSCGCVHAAYKCYIFVENGNVARDQMLRDISNRGIPCYSGSCSEIYREEAFTKRGLLPKERLPVAKALGDSSLMFLCHPTLISEEIALTCDAIKSAAGNVS